jgi:hypothetical protein
VKCPDRSGAIPKESHCDTASRAKSGRQSGSDCDWYTAPDDGARAKHTMLVLRQMHRTTSASGPTIPKSQYLSARSPDGLDQLVRGIVNQRVECRPSDINQDLGDYMVMGAMR